MQLHIIYDIGMGKYILLLYDNCGGVVVRNIVVRGGRRLEGCLDIQGAKNSVLPILAATILSEEESIIYGCPDLSDVNNSLKILSHLGCKIKREEDAVIINPANIHCGNIPDLLMHRMRSSITFLGAVTARCKKAKMTSPGGCELGPRPIDLHIKALKELNILFKECAAVMETDGENIKGAQIYLDFPSVGATENVILAAAMAEGNTIINNAAKEPEIWDLQEFLNKMGAKISGAGTDVIYIEGVKKLHGATHRIIPDRIVAATYLSAAMMTGGDITLGNIKYNHMNAVEALLRDMGACISRKDSTLRLKAPKRIQSISMLRTLPYPGFPTDAQAPVTAALSVADGVSIIVENIFENRFKHCHELCKMGADIKISGRIAVIRGVRKLYGAPVNAMELRGGAALVIAGLAADGVTRISDIEHIERGYQDITGDLKMLGADIKIN